MERGAEATTASITEIIWRGMRCRVIDLVRARLDAKNDCNVAELPSLNLRDVRIDDQLLRDNERMLTDGFYAEVTLSYDGIIAQEKGGSPFKVDGSRPIQMSKSDVLATYEKGRRAFTTADWVDFLLRSIGLEPSAFNELAKRVARRAANLPSSA